MTSPKPRVVLGVSAGIAAYKACELLRRLTESGHDVTVVPTADALRFVGEPTWAALSGKPVSPRVWDGVAEVPHVRLGQQADLVFVAPATADLLAKAAHGLADDLLTNTLLTARCPVVFAPAMHTEMWQHPATQANVATLRERGAVVVEPASGRLTGKDTGPGRLPDPAELFEVARHVLARGAAGRDLAGRHVVVSAGGTREAIDPVRFIGNRSSGLQGHALARTAAARGARVTLVSANVALPDPAGAEIVAVGSAEEMRKAVVEAAGSADAVVMAAAVADFRPAGYRGSKIKKTEGAEPEPIRLVKNPDILAELGRIRRPGQVVVGFAAETDDVLANGQAKLARKGSDLLVVNQVGENLTFGRPDNAAVILGADGSRTEVPRGAKEALAEVVWDLVAARLERTSSGVRQGEGHRAR
ncbi:bifunctional phosphopantothenoylcysteine decarboxylase/phosphopantothenate--cysteine ligase CoaBC [Actinomadura citrea]|jgi:phosphopantothenoylcysteine decarboxylase/phosphopantothenate--cysteine ligase|uniref:Coenzyme A biosynthesis bifunctional protein CoaBC n=1 Tax=Actinomadura citrea TaxID=46158 RepID=A0A7Y9G9U7_9ACTN|nr:bifunctional phosphopantothenoylcysteine decarboxylase/phosphopantothenate--cysteine ligase CoaBC [Actinomadura citrea]NYE12615.1 phosphopantothenoylcysteine decarboxylase/phosphopantothenate--cysteine ligase [Actinomadura citrea]GGT53243.1 phosphopantothenoylcysteine decarboxylase [Actinomadura citrea]